MKKLLLILILLLTPALSLAQTNTHQGGTGLIDVSAGSVLFGVTPALRLGTSSALQFNNAASRLTVTNASTTVLSATTFCLTGDTCKTAWPTGGGSSTFGTTSVSALAPLSWSTALAQMSITQAGLSTDGYLSGANFTLFNNKISSTSLSGASVISYTSSTGVITTTPGSFAAGDYVFGNKVTIPFASSTAVSANTFCIGVDCRTSWPSGGGTGGAVATSTNETSTQVPFWTSTSGTPATLGSSAGFTYLSTPQRLTFTYGSSTAISAATFIGALIGNSSTATALAANGTNCSAGSYPLGIDASGNVETCTAAGTGTVTSVAAGLGFNGGTITNTGTLSLISYLATSSAETKGQLAVFGSTNGTPALLYSQSTSTLTASAPLTGTFTQIGSGGSVGCTTAASGVAGCLSNTAFDTFNNKQATISATWPITLTGAAVGFNGLSTSSTISAGQSLYATGVNTIAGVATSAVTFSAPLSGTTFNVVGTGGGAITITQSGTGANGYLSSTDFQTFNNKISSTSLSGASVINYTSSSGVISTVGGTFGAGDYIFPNKATIPFASTTALTVSTTASTTNLIVSALGSAATSCVQASVNGTLSITGSACGGAGSTAGGNNTEIQFNSATAFGGALRTSWDSTNLRFGIGTTTPFAKLSIQGQANDAAISRTLFAIGSSTQSATSTLFSILNTGATNIFNSSGTSVFSVDPTATTGDIFDVASTTGQLLLNVTQAGNVGVGTSTPNWLMQLFSSAKAQLVLSYDSVSPHWTFNNIAGNLFLATSSPTTLATSTNANGNAGYIEFPSNGGCIGCSDILLPGGINLLNAKYVNATTTSSFAANAMNDLYTAPAGRRALVMSTQVYNATAGSITYNTKLKSGGNYYAMAVATSTANANNGGAQQNGEILEPGESVSVISSSASLNMWVFIIEFDASTPFFSAKSLGPALNATTTLVTIPSGVTGTIVGINPLNTRDAPVAGIDADGGSLTAKFFIVKSGGTAIDALNRFTVGNSNNIGTASFSFMFPLNSGDSLQAAITTTGGNNTNLWLNIYEH